MQGGPHHCRLLIKSRYCDLDYNLSTSLCFTELNGQSACWATRKRRPGDLL